MIEVRIVQTESHFEAERAIGNHLRQGYYVESFTVTEIAKHPLYVALLIKGE